MTPEEIQQLKHEIKWLEDKMESIRQEMYRRPSKIKHFMNLNFQKKEKLERLKYAEIEDQNK